MPNYQEFYLDWVKKRVRIRTDYQLAKYLEMTPSRLCQLRQERLKFSLAECIIIAKILNIEALEIIASVELKRAKPHEFEIVKTAYFESLMKTISDRMNENCSGTFYLRKNKRS